MDTLGSKLTNKQRAFVTHYLQDMNATRAAIAAGYSEASAGVEGARLLKNAKIADEIDAFLAQYAMSAAEVLYHLTDIARADFADLTDSIGNLDMEKARRNKKTRLIKRVKTRTITTDNSETHETELELYDRLTALGMLAKYHNLTNTVKVDDWRSEAIRDIREGRLTFDALAKAFDDDLATELFAAAGVPVQVG